MFKPYQETFCFVPRGMKKLQKQITPRGNILGKKRSDRTIYEEKYTADTAKTEDLLLAIKQKLKIS